MKKIQVNGSPTQTVYATRHTHVLSRCIQADDAPGVDKLTPPRSQWPRLPTDLALQIERHPFCETARSRYIERSVAAQAAVDPQAQSAARALLDAMWTQASSLAPEKTRQDVFGSFAGYETQAAAPRYWADGDINVHDVPVAFEQGNLRELMTMVFNGSFVIERLLVGAGRLAAGPFEPAKDSPAAQTYAMRRKRLGLAPSQLQTADKLCSERCPPLSQREQTHLSTWLAGRHEAGDPAFKRLPTQLGKHVWKLRLDHPWVKHSIAQGLHVTAGISRTTHRFMAVNRYLGNAAEPLSLRRACVGYLVPNHHSLHEVLTAATYFACDYDPAGRLADQ